MKVAIYSSKAFEEVYLEKSNDSKHELYFIKESLSVETASLSQGCESIAVFTNDDVSSKVLDKLNHIGVRHIAVRAAGYDQVDLKKATELKMNVANVPEYSPYAIAEYAIAMMLTLNRKIIRADHQVKDFNFSLNELIGFDLHGKTVGIVGVGKIGAIVAKILHGFGCQILGVDIRPNQELTEQYGLRYTTLKELCSEADIISIHAPLTLETKYLINKSSLSLMKKGVMIINTSRGALLNTSDAIDALKEGKIGYLGLDVYEKEKGMFFSDHSHEIMQDDLFSHLLTFKNVLVTGHQAFLTENALKNIADATIYNLDCWATGEASKYELIH
ncbi:MAG: hydroxyacid dehydrogenase [Chitinophagaceae bacterium]|nr:hydroxyacid dehydrogenase [Chitinophagaceae bacterium]